MNNEKEKIAWLRLVRSENVGPVTFRQLSALEAIPDMVQRAGGKKKIILCPHDVAQKEYENTIALGGKIIASYEDEYPDLLKEIHDYPPILSVIGDGKILQKKSLGIVGTRNATINGKQIAKKLGYDLAGGGYVIASGLALGIDRAAHEGAIMAGDGNTIAVIGCGVDVCYPEQNKDVYEQIKEKGIIISEFPLGSSPQAMNFPRRNRIISGLSLGIIVVEAQKRSGSLITARLALEQNREVFAVPGSPLDSRGGGPNHLIKEGAVLIESAGDVLDVVDNRSHFVLRENTQTIIEPEFEAVKETEIDSARKIVLENLGVNSITIDNIICETGLSYSLISMILL